MMNQSETVEFFHTVDLGDLNRPNRMCVCISDVHFTDGTVGVQSRGDWDDFFDQITLLCEDRRIEELVFVLDGDVVDMIRTKHWAERGVYPWERDHPAFPEIVTTIVRGIVEQHCGHAGGHCRFFQMLQELPKSLEKNGVKKVDVLVLLGNHDKEILAVPEALKLFYEDCLGWTLKDIPADYRRKVGRMYGDENQFMNPDSAPWFPFYYADIGFRLFVTHGQWRDGDNSRALPEWTVEKGWQIETWKRLRYRPFTDPCFGDTVAAGVLSGFIWKAKRALAEEDQRRIALSEAKSEGVSRLERVLDELDLYRPSYLAVSRIIEETRKLKERPDIARTIEKLLQDCILEWLSWDFTYESSPQRRRIGLKFLRGWLWIASKFHRWLELKAIEWFMKILAGFRTHHRVEAVTFKEMKTFPAFLPENRIYGFHIHGEGHTHNPLQEEPDIAPGQNYTYINFGTWRDQIVEKNAGHWFVKLLKWTQPSYRRRSVGRALFVLDLKPAAGESKRDFSYWVEDNLTWSDKLDWK
jgi:UDP-2,3-diacylglucosamine pyrophosphatase LpxH